MASSRIITVLGAGRSAKWLIENLFSLSGSRFTLQVYDLARPEWADHLGDVLKVDDLADPEVIKEIVEGSDLVVSLLPPVMHTQVAALCADDGCHFVSASYQSQAVKDLDEKARHTNSFIISEAGLDPGIDHITALNMIHEIKRAGGRISSFESYCGGIPAQYGQHGYKFFWNPWNVVTAGTDGAKYLKEGCVAMKPYHRLFRDFTTVADSAGNCFEAYPNRDSIPYLAKYGLEDSESFVRGTLRLPGFCDFWSNLIDAGLTNNTIRITEEDIHHSPILSDWIPADIKKSGTSRYSFLDEKLTSDEVGSTLAEVLLKRLLKIWSPSEYDFDRVVMIHRITYESNGRRHLGTFEMDITGNGASSAMSYTVSLPIFLIIKLYLDQKLVPENHFQFGSLTVMDEPLRTMLYEELTESGLPMKESTITLE